MSYEEARDLEIFFARIYFQRSAVKSFQQYSYTVTVDLSILCIDLNLLKSQVIWKFICVTELMSASTSSSMNPTGDDEAPRGRSSFGLKITSTSSIGNVGVGVFSHSSSSSTSQIQRNNAMALVPAQPKLSRITTSGGGGGAGNSQSDENSVKEILSTVFFKKENSERIIKNIAILTESRYGKMFVTFNGGDIKKPDAKLEQDMKATFGKAGWQLYLMLLRLVNVSKVITNLKRYELKLILFNILMPFTNRFYYFKMFMESFNH